MLTGTLIHEAHKNPETTFMNPGFRVMDTFAVRAFLTEFLPLQMYLLFFLAPWSAEIYQPKVDTISYSSLCTGKYM